jgi:protein ImuB
MRLPTGDYQPTTGDIRLSTDDCRPTTLFACIRAPRMPDLPMAVAREFSPRVQRHGEACVVCDVSGLERLLGDPDTIGSEIARACAARAGGDGVAIAVAATQMSALLLTMAAPGGTVVAGHPADALAPIPLRVLQQLLAGLHGVTFLRAKRQRLQARHKAVWDAYERCFEVFERWGLKTLGDLAALPAADLAARVGQEGVGLRTFAAGVDLAPLAPDPEVPRFLARVDLEWPIDGLEPLSFVLARMLDPLSITLERADRGAAAIRLDLRLVDRTMHARMLQLPAAMRDPKVLRTLLVLDLESHPPHAAIDIVTIEIDPAPGRVLQHSLLERARPTAETLATLTARLAALVGESRAGQAVLRDTHQPDVFEMHRFAPSEHERSVAEVTDAGGSADAPLHLRRFRPPLAVRVHVERGRPARVLVDRRGMPGGIVERSAGPWRTSGAWWQANARDAQDWDRDEWDVALSDGSVCRLFRARADGKWFLEGVVD